MWALLSLSLLFYCSRLSLTMEWIGLFFLIVCFGITHNRPTTSACLPCEEGMLSVAHEPIASWFLQMCSILLFLNGTGEIWDWQTVAYGGSENKALLEHGHTHWFPHCLWLLCLWPGWVVAAGNTLPTSLKYILSSSLVKCLTIPGLGQNIF